MNKLIYSLSAFITVLLVSILAPFKEALAGSPPPVGCASGTSDLNCMIENFLDNTVNLPGFVSAAAYLTGLALGVKGVLDFSKHATLGAREMPIRTPIIELVVAALLLALPVTYDALLDAVMGGTTFNIAGATFYSTTGSSNVYVTLGGTVTSWGSPSAACASASYSSMIGGIFCSMWDRISNIPGLLAGFAYIAGLSMMYFATISLKDSVENPSQTPLFVPFQRFVVAALLLALPITLETAIQTLFPGVSTSQSTTDFNLSAMAGGQTLDFVVMNFVFSIYGAFQFVLWGFGYIAGIVLIIIGIFRMMKTMQDGPRGPGGIGTIMTFITGAALLALGPTMAAFSTTLFGDSTSETKVCLSIDSTACTLSGMDDYEKRLANFISAIVAYMIIVGWISFARGLFIFRGVAEGDQQASTMSAVTHLIAGTLLVNLGPFLTTVINTLGPVAGLPTLTFS